MMEKNQRHELNYDLICRAVKGCPEALEEVLLYYDHYIDALSAYEIKDENGVVHRKIDPDMKAEIQCRLIAAIKKWRELI